MHDLVFLDVNSTIRTEYRQVHESSGISRVSERGSQRQTSKLNLGFQTQIITHVIAPTDLVVGLALQRLSVDNQLLEHVTA